jgi:hypothetical protein
MASFYNPYMKGPDFGGGLGELGMQILQLLMAQRMFPQGQKTQVAPTPLPTTGAGAPFSRPPVQQPPPQMGAGPNMRELQSLLALLLGMPTY